LARSGPPATTSLDAAAQPDPDDAMKEIELRFQIPAALGDAVEAAVATASARRTRLRATYFDTPSRRLAEAGLALRVRKEGRRWVQTLKGGGPYAFARFEHNVELAHGQAGDASAAPLPDPALHAGTEGGTALARALRVRKGEQPESLEALFRTDIRRCRRELRVGGGSVELACDRGLIASGERAAPICELEIELQRGSSLAVIEAARRWVSRFGLWLEVRSKAERGARLAAWNAAPSSAEPAGPVQRAVPLRLGSGSGVDAALRAVVGNCLGHILPNASEVASGHHAPEHVHQLRVGLRRLRTALRLFDGHTSLIDPAWAATLAEVFALLGGTRDRDALGAEVIPALRGAGAPWVELPAPIDAADPALVARSGRFTQIMLDLLTLANQADEPGQPSGENGFAALARERLTDWHREVRRDAKRFHTLDDPARHRLRRRVKRLRYAAEFAASLFDAKAVARYLEQLAPVQGVLGRANDVNVALALFRSQVETVPAAWFAVGRLTAWRESLLDESAAALKKFRDAEPFWERRR
jgi:triphosphatase